jgi:hypothetical protein
MPKVNNRRNGENTPDLVTLHWRKIAQSGLPDLVRVVESTL